MSHTQATAMTDEDWMRLALGEARKGVGRTAPNPPVGSVIVKDRGVIGRGWHRAAGRPHAEREAMADAVAQHGRDSLRGATAYVTLEPCSSHGRTPPCTEGLIAAGIRRVVYACTDPNPAHAGRADRLLRAHGIAVTSGVLAEEAESMLRPFFKVQRTGLPWVIWKSAMSLDGRLTRPSGEGQWLSNPISRLDVQRLRGEVDAILTSGETVRRDRPRLTIREAALLEGRDQPWRVVLTRDPASLPMDAPLFCDEWHHRTLVRSQPSLEEVLRELAGQYGVLSVMLESGGQLAARFATAGLIDEVALYLAPMLSGGAITAMAGAAGLNLELEQASFERLGDDVRLKALVTKKAAAG